MTPGTRIRPRGAIHHSVSDLRVNSERSIAYSRVPPRSAASAARGLRFDASALGLRTPVLGSHINDTLDKPMTVLEPLDPKRRVGRTLDLDGWLVSSAVHRLSPRVCMQVGIL